MPVVMSADPWKQVANQAALGDRVAARRLIDGVTPTLLRLVRSILGPGRRADIEDVTQETLLQLLAALESFRGDCSVAHFACRIAVRTAVRARRRRQAREAATSADSVAVDESPAAGGAADDELAAERRRAALRALLDELPEVQAQTLALRIVLGCSMAEVAETTAAPLNTVRSRLRLAKEALRRRILEDPTLAAVLEVDE